MKLYYIVDVSIEWFKKKKQQEEDWNGGIFKNA